MAHRDRRTGTVERPQPAQSTDMMLGDLPLDTGVLNKLKGHEREKVHLYRHFLFALVRAYNRPHNFVVVRFGPNLAIYDCEKRAGTISIRVLAEILMIEPTQAQDPETEQTRSNYPVGPVLKGLGIDYVQTNRTEIPNVWRSN